MALTSPPPLTVLQMDIVSYMYCYSSVGSINIYHHSKLWKIELFTESSSQFRVSNRSLPESLP